MELILRVKDVLPARTFTSNGRTLYVQGYILTNGYDDIFAEQLSYDPIKAIRSSEWRPFNLKCSAVSKDGTSFYTKFHINLK